MNRPYWSSLARKDINAIFAHYEAIDPMLAVEMIDRVIALPASLLDNPAIGSPLGGDDLRKWRIRNTPFMLIYQDQNNRLEILRVVHAASDWHLP